MWTYNYELYHHGIKGQRWGVRRFQNEDGTLTEAGKKRYNVNIDLAKEKVKEARFKKDVAYERYVKQGGSDRKSQFNKASKDLYWAKRDLDSEKIKDKLNSERNKSKHREKLEDKYRARGMSEEEAAIAAYKRARVEKSLALVGGMTVAAAAAYVAYKEYDTRIDKVLSSKTVFKRVASDSETELHDGYYTTYKKRDHWKYTGAYGDQIRWRLRFSGVRNPVVQQKTIEAPEGLRVASEKHARDALRYVLSTDPSARSKLESFIDQEKKIYERQGRTRGSQYRMLQQAHRSLKSGKIDSNVYYALNFGFAGEPNEVGYSVIQRLRQKGYDAIEDINDKRLSGYRSKSALIVINAAKTKVKSVREVTEDETDSDLRKFDKWLHDVAKREALAEQIKTGAAMGLPAASIAAGYSVVIPALKKSKEQKIVDEYRRDHPDTELSYNEILKNYNG